MSYTPEKAVREAMEEEEAKKADKPKSTVQDRMKEEGVSGARREKFEQVASGEYEGPRPAGPGPEISVETQEVPDDKPKGRMMPAMEIEGKPPETETTMDVDGREVPDDGDLYDKIRREPLEIKGDPDAELEPDRDAERLEAELDNNEMVRIYRNAGEERKDEMAKLQDDLGIDPQADREKQVTQAVEWLYDNEASDKDMQLMFSALSLYNNGRASWDSVLEAAAAAKAYNPGEKKAEGDYEGPQKMEPEA